MFEAYLSTRNSEESSNTEDQASENCRLDMVESVHL